MLLVKTIIWKFWTCLKNLELYFIKLTLCHAKIAVLLKAMYSVTKVAPLAPTCVTSFMNGPMFLKVSFKRRLIIY